MQPGHAATAHRLLAFLRTYNSEPALWPRGTGKYNALNKVARSGCCSCWCPPSYSNLGHHNGGVRSQVCNLKQHLSSTYLVQATPCRSCAYLIHDKPCQAIEATAPPTTLSSGHVHGEGGPPLGACTDRRERLLPCMCLPLIAAGKGKTRHDPRQQLASHICHAPCHVSQAPAQRAPCSCAAARGTCGGCRGWRWRAPLLEAVHSRPRILAVHIVGQRAALQGLLRPHHIPYHIQHAFAGQSRFLCPF
jgi:hypothetical protein